MCAWTTLHEDRMTDFSLVNQKYSIKYTYMNLHYLFRIEVLFEKITNCF